MKDRQMFSGRLRVTHTFRIAALCLAVLASVSARAAGVAFGPGMVFIVDVPLGKETRLPAEQSFEIHNYSDRAIVFTLSIAKPSGAALAEWELGYDEIPDPAWCRLDRTQIEVAAKSKSHGTLFVTVPDKAEHANRRWMAAVVCRANPSTGGTGLALQLVSRVGIETVANAAAEGQPESLAAVPSLVRIQDGIPGKEYDVEVKLINRTAAAQAIAIRRLAEMESDGSKHSRYFRPGRLPVVRETWIASRDPVTVMANSTSATTLKIAIPAQAARGGAYEEILFFKSDSERPQMLRVQIDVAPIPRE